MVLDDLGVKQIAAAVGGSMGGMLVQEYAFFGPQYVRTIVPIATSSRHSAWGISWGEAQRQSIYSDPKYDDGYYSFDDPPSTGLGAARMSALLTYRSRDSFEHRFGRNTPHPSKNQKITESLASVTSVNEHWAVHNDGHKNARSSRPMTPTTNTSPPRTPQEGQPVLNGGLPAFTDPQFSGTRPFKPSTPPTPVSERRRAATYFSAQSYLRYQGEKFVKRFDSNCYIAITRKLDTHDISRHRVSPDDENPARAALAQIKQPALVIGIESDGLFTFAEQKEIAEAIPNGRLREILSPEGHDAFLLQFEQVNKHILEFFNETLSDIMTGPGTDDCDWATVDAGGVGSAAKDSTFGEAEVGDITAW